MKLKKLDKIGNTKRKIKIVEKSERSYKFLFSGKPYVKIDEESVNAQN